MTSTPAERNPEIGLRTKVQRPVPQHSSSKDQRMSQDTRFRAQGDPTSEKVLAALSLGYQLSDSWLQPALSTPHRFRST